MKDNWAVIGAGPAGIAVLTQLLTLGVQPQQILWFDPAFRVGDFGTHWKNVSSNTKVKLFSKFIEHCSKVCSEDRPAFSLDTIPQEETCLLTLAAQPLHWVTEQLQQQVQCVRAQVAQLRKEHNRWHLQTNTGEYYSATNVVLAIGAEPKSLSHVDTQEIPLKIALDKEQLQSQVTAADCVAVFGASHSAVLVMRDLLELGVKVVNFYQSSPLLKYAVYHADWIENDNTGLKGKAAEWARENLEVGKTLPANLVRVAVTAENVAACLPKCTKAVYAIGFARRTVRVEGLAADFNYDHETGKIAEGLFGAGIAFPRLFEDRLGNREYRVGLWKFMEDLRYWVPGWLGDAV